MAGLSRFETHEVTNQSPPFEDVDLFTTDRPLQDAVRANGAEGETAALAAFGRRWGAAHMFAQAGLANSEAPRFAAFDAQGFRRDVVEYHPAYHQFMAESIGAGLHAMTWRAYGARAAAPSEVARAARCYMVAQVENGHMCPVTMTRAAVAALAPEPALAARLLPQIMSRSYDPSFRPWWEKSGITLGMGMTEKQGGTDVRSNTTRAVPADDGYLVTGHKWFMSAPMCDAFLVLAQAPGGLPVSSCRASVPTAAPTACASSASRTSSATAPTPRPRSSSPRRWRGRSAKRAGARAPSSAWCS